MKPEAVNHPSHYNMHPSGVECIDIIEHMSFNIGSAIKYLWRCEYKNATPHEDLKKALWYIQREIERADKETNIDKTIQDLGYEAAIKDSVVESALESIIPDDIPTTTEINEANIRVKPAYIDIVSNPGIINVRDQATYEIVYQFVANASFHAISTVCLKEGYAVSPDNFPTTEINKANLPVRPAYIDNRYYADYIHIRDTATHIIVNTFNKDTSFDDIYKVCLESGYIVARA